MNDNYGWCQFCGALVFGSSQCHKCDGKVKKFCVDMQLVKLRDESRAKSERIKELEKLAGEAIGGPVNEFELLLASERGGRSQILQLERRIKELETELQEVANQLMDLYTKCNETTEPEIYGAILGLHERLEKALES